MSQIEPSVCRETTNDWNVCSANTAKLFRFLAAAPTQTPKRKTHVHIKTKGKSKGKINNNSYTQVIDEDLL